MTKEYFTKKSIFVLRCNKYTHDQKVKKSAMRGFSNMSFALFFQEGSSIMGRSSSIGGSSNLSRASLSLTRLCEEKDVLDHDGWNLKTHFKIKKNFTY
jgi:hypothetical protein